MRILLKYLLTIMAIILWRMTLYLNWQLEKPEFTDSRQRPQEPYHESFYKVQCRLNKKEPLVHRPIDNIDKVINMILQM